MRRHISGLGTVIGKREESAVPPTELPKPETLVSNSRRNKAVAAAFIGTIIEWYDFFIYGTAAALIFPKLFFPNESEAAGTIYSFGTFAAGFLFRPIGAVIFGNLGDRLGRKRSLIWTLVLMGVSTFLVGCLPAFDRIGVLAPIALTALRCVQGIAAGGEWGGAILLSVEHSARGRRGWYGSWTQAGLPVGLLLSNGVFNLCSSIGGESFIRWAWRIPFLAGLVLAIIGYIIRQHVEETPLFLQTAEIERRRGNPVLRALTEKWRSVLMLIGARIAENAAFYLYTVFVLAYCTQYLSLPKSLVLNGLLVASVLELFTIPMFGALSDRIGRKKVYLTGLFVILLLAFPYFWLLQTRNPALVWLAIALSLALGHGAVYGPQAAFFAECFGTEMRYSGVSLGLQLAAPIGGGLAPIIAIKLLTNQHGNPWLVSVYVSVIVVISIAAVMVARETYKDDLD